MKCRTAGKPDTLVRVACRELESWYFGDLAAVERGLRIPDLVRLQNRRKYRVPDQIHAPSKELVNVTRNEYGKVAGSRAIGPHLSLTENRSHSFRVFITGLRNLVEMARRI